VRLRPSAIPPRAYYALAVEIPPQPVKLRSGPIPPFVGNIGTWGGWRGSPRNCGSHLLDRVAGRNITKDGLMQVLHWIEGNPILPVGVWFKRFEYVTIPK
jgi:hypothetical protein